MAVWEPNEAALGPESGMGTAMDLSPRAVQRVLQRTEQFQVEEMESETEISRSIKS